MGEELPEYLAGAGQATHIWESGREFVDDMSNATAVILACRVCYQFRDAKRTKVHSTIWTWLNHRVIEDLSHRQRMRLASMTSLREMISLDLAQ